MAINLQQSAPHYTPRSRVLNPHLSNVVANPAHRHIDEQQADCHNEEHQGKKIAATLIQLGCEYVHNFAQQQRLSRIHTSYHCQLTKDESEDKAPTHLLRHC